MQHEYNTYQRKPKAEHQQVNSQRTVFKSTPQTRRPDQVSQCIRNDTARNNVNTISSYNAIYSRTGHESVRINMPSSRIPYRSTRSFSTSVNRFLRSCFLNLVSHAMKKCLYVLATVVVFPLYLLS